MRPKDSMIYHEEQVNNKLKIKQFFLETLVAEEKVHNLVSTVLNHLLTEQVLEQDYYNKDLVRQQTQDNRPFKINKQCNKPTQV